jgi:DNA repair exonuclease SbcCD nuclease subunit
MSKPIAVLISDVHYNIHTLELADKAMRMAIDKANQLDVPLIVAGDLHDTKANLRGECVLAILATFNLCEHTPYVLVGNHDKINEKSDWNEHSLHFLAQTTRVIGKPEKWKDWTLIPYCSNSADAYYSINNGGNKFIMHQGISAAESGDYIQDKTALDVSEGLNGGVRVISGHYHTRQTTLLPSGGKWDYIGNPYSLTWGEAKDPEKGFQILYDDGSLEFVPTNLRKHVIIDMHLADIKLGEYTRHDAKPGDLVWVKLSGPRERLQVWDKQSIGRVLELTDFKLTYEYAQDAVRVKNKQKDKPELIDSIIDNLDGTAEYKARLKDKWRQLV